MEQKPMTILLIEDEEIECQKFKSYIDTVQNAKLVAITNSSDKAIELFKMHIPEAIVLDIELHKGQGSGIEFLEKLKGINKAFKPIIVVTTNASTALLYDKLHDDGADFIFYKHQEGYSQKAVVSALLSLRKSLYKYSSNSECNENITVQTQADLMDKISMMINTELDLVGISPHLKGRDYIHEAIMYLVETDNTDKEESVFNHLANIYKKTASSVARVMQTSINRAWRTSSTEELELHYTAKINYYTGVPTPTEFVYYYAKKIKNNI